jgi:hypothetical protein
MGTAGLLDKLAVASRVINRNLARVQNPLYDKALAPRPILALAPLDRQKRLGHL